MTSGNAVMITHNQIANIKERLSSYCVVDDIRLTENSELKQKVKNKQFKITLYECND
jgi:uncharacterized protein YlbG (UPF0298 family)